MLVADARERLAVTTVQLVTRESGFGAGSCVAPGADGRRSARDGLPWPVPRRMKLRRAANSASNQFNQDP